MGDSDMRYDFLNQHDILQHEPPENNTSEAKVNIPIAIRSNGDYY